MSTETTETETESGKSGRPLSAITTSQIETAVKLYNKGWSVKRIVETKQAGKQTAKTWASVQVANLYHHLRQHPDVDMRSQGRKGLSDEQKALVVEQYEAGHTLSAIRKLPELKATTSKTKMFALPTLSAVVKEAGLEVRLGRRPNEEEEEAAAE